MIPLPPGSRVRLSSYNAGPFLRTADSITRPMLEKAFANADERAPLVTIVTPTFNRARYLEEAMNSVLDQDYQNLEYIVIDDGSTDDTPAILDRYAARSANRLRRLRQDNAGQARAINRGFELARGQLLGTVSSDDTLLPGAVSALVAALTDPSDPDVGLAYGDELHVDAEGGVIRQWPKVEYSLGDMVRAFTAQPGASALFRRELFDRVGGWDPSFRFCPDYDWYLRAGLVTRFRHVRRTLATWRVHVGSISAGQQGQAMAHDFVRVIEHLFKHPDLPDEVERLRNEALRTAYIVAAMVIGGTPNTPDERFEVVDRIVTMHSAPGQPLVSVHTTIDCLHRALASLHTEVAHRDQTVAWLHREVADRDATIAWLHREVAQRDRAVERLQAQLATHTTDSGHSE